MSSLIKGFEEDFEAGTLTLNLDRDKLAFYELTARQIVSKLAKREGLQSSADGDAIKVKITKKREPEVNENGIRARAQVGNNRHGRA